MRRTTVVVVGAGHAGLAMSKQLSDRSVDHIVLERGEIANSWRTERWDSLRLLTPNWQSRLPGMAYRGNDPDGYMDMPQVIQFLKEYAATIAAPVETQTTVTGVRSVDSEYIVRTTSGDWACRKLVIASGACNIPSIPKLAQDLPDYIDNLAAMNYRNPTMIKDGGVLVVGASATGIQLAMEIQASGRQVTVSTGEHVRVPRVYRGHDIKWWMDRTGVLDMRYDEVDDVNRARRVASLQLVGTPERATLDLNALQAAGVEVAGRLAAIRDGRALFSGGLPNQCALADLKMNRLLQSIDEWAVSNKFSDCAPSERFKPTRVPTPPLLSMDLAERGIRTIIWATGYYPDYSWLTLPVFDRKGRIRHDGGIGVMSGLYVLGLPFLRRRKSSLIDGAADDTHDLATHLEQHLRAVAA
ncbi:MAG: NAD(P)-binding domain-containing protein [Hyphomicrobiaceae bacterium]